MSNTLITIGAALLGSLAPEALQAISTRALKIPNTYNFLCGVATGLITYGFLTR